VIALLLDEHEVVVRLNNAPTIGYEHDVGSFTTLRLTNTQYEGVREYHLNTTSRAMSLSLSSANTYSSSAAQNVALCAAGGGGRPKTTPTLMLFRRNQRRRSGFPTRSSLTKSDTFSDVNDDERKKKKRAVLKEKLIESCRGTYRGAIGFSNDREREDIRNAKEALEKFGPEEEEKEEDWMRNRVNGRWKLIYTTALDVTGVLVFSVPPPP
jgi:hypothetical protein